MPSHNKMFIELFLLIFGAARQGGLLKFGLFLSLPLVLFGIIALLITVIKFVKMFREAQIVRVPLHQQSEIEIKQKGNLNLSLQAPMLTVFPGQELNYKLINQRSGEDVELRPLSPRSASRRHSFSKITFPVRSFNITEPAEYLLLVGGFNPQTDYSEYSLIIEKPTGTKSVFHILAIILFGGISIVGFALTISLLNA